ncbi:transcriptional regulator [Erysipelotrichaceae bacterium]|nr:transcriptional regulator [Erysipelotrichaceae bacterium]
MKSDFFQKKGTAIKQLAEVLIVMQPGEKLPIVSVLQENLGISRGTVQNALQFLKDQDAIVLVSRGHLGNYLTSINHRILQQYAGTDELFGTMPLPYSRIYEGLATALYDTLNAQGVRLNMAYIRGSNDRLQSVVRGMYQFAIVSKYAARRSIEMGESLKIIADLGKYSYLSQHILLLKNPNATTIVAGDRVGIDMSSIDQKELTHILTANTKVSYINLPGHQLIHEIELGRIDAGVWNYDEIIEKNYEHLNYQLISDMAISEEVSTAVIVCNQSDILVQTVLEKNIDTIKILQIQQDVKKGKIIPRY